MTTINLPSQNGEEWRLVKNTNGRYYISNFGRLISVTKRRGVHVLENVNKKGGYLSVVLEGENGFIYTRLHRLVYEAFVGEIPKGHKFHIHHKDHNKQNNRVDNLELVTAKEHYQKDIDSRDCEGMNNYNKYIRPNKIVQKTLDGEFVAIFNNAKEAHDATGVCQRNILQVASKQEGRKQAGGFIWEFASEQ